MSNDRIGKIAAWTGFGLTAVFFGWCSVQLFENASKNSNDPEKSRVVSRLVFLKTNLAKIAGVYADPKSDASQYQLVAGRLADLCGRSESGAAAILSEGQSYPEAAEGLKEALETVQRACELRERLDARISREEKMPFELQFGAYLHHAIANLEMASSRLSQTTAEAVALANQNRYSTIAAGLGAALLGGLLFLFLATRSPAEEPAPATPQSDPLHASDGSKGRERSWLAAAAHGSSDSILYVDEALEIKGVNETAERLLGYNPDELASQPVTLLLPLLSADRLERLSASSAGQAQKLKARHKNGSSMNLGVRVRKSRSGHILFLREDDLTIVVPAESPSEEAFGVCAAPVFVTDTGGMVTLMNAAAESVTGRRASNAGSRPFWHEIFPSAHTAAILEAFHSGEAFEIPPSADSAQSFRWSRTAISGRDGKVRRWVYTGSAQPLRQAPPPQPPPEPLTRKLAFDTGLAIGSHLSVIDGYADLLLQCIPTADPLHDDIGLIRQAATRAALLAEQLRLFGEEIPASQPEPGPGFDLSASLDKLLPAMRGVLDERVGFSIDATLLSQGHSQTIAWDRRQFEKAVLCIASALQEAIQGEMTLQFEAAPGELTVSARPAASSVVKPAAAPNLAMLVAESLIAGLGGSFTRGTTGNPSCRIGFQSASSSSTQSAPRTQASVA